MLKYVIICFGFVFFCINISVWFISKNVFYGFDKIVVIKLKIMVIWKVVMVLNKKNCSYSFVVIKNCVNIYIVIIFSYVVIIFS